MMSRLTYEFCAMSPGERFFRKDYLISLYSFSGLCCLEACNIKKKKKKKKKEMLCVPFLYGTRIQFATGLIPRMRNKVIMNLEGNSELTFCCWKTCFV